MSFGAVAPEGAPCPAMAAPMPMRSRGALERARASRSPRDLAKKAREFATTLSDGLGGGGGYGGMMEEEADDAAAQRVEPQDNWLDFNRLVLSEPTSAAAAASLVRAKQSASLPAPAWPTSKSSRCVPPKGCAIP